MADTERLTTEAAFEQIMKPVLEAVQDPATVAKASFHVMISLMHARNTILPKPYYAPNMTARDLSGTGGSLAARHGLYPGGDISAPAYPAQIETCAAKLCEDLKGLGLTEDVANKAKAALLEAVPASMEISEHKPRRERACRVG